MYVYVVIDAEVYHQCCGPPNMVYNNFSCTDDSTVIVSVKVEDNRSCTPSKRTLRPACVELVKSLVDLRTLGQRLITWCNGRQVCTFNSKVLNIKTLVTFTLCKENSEENCIKIAYNCTESKLGRFFP